MSAAQSRASINASVLEGPRGVSDVGSPVPGFNQCVGSRGTARRVGCRQPSPGLQSTRRFSKDRAACRMSAAQSRASINASVLEGPRGVSDVGSPVPGFNQRVGSRRTARRVGCRQPSPGLQSTRRFSRDRAACRMSAAQSRASINASVLEGPHGVSDVGSPVPGLNQRVGSRRTARRVGCRQPSPGPQSTRRFSKDRAASRSLAPPWLRSRRQQVSVASRGNASSWRAACLPPLPVPGTRHGSRLSSVVGERNTRFPPPPVQRCGLLRSASSRNTSPTCTQ